MMKILQECLGDRGVFMKYLLISVLFCVCVAVGFALSSKYMKRKRFFNALISLSEKLALEINFSRERLRVLIENFDSSSKKYLLGIDEVFVDYLERKCELTQESLFKKALVLKDDEKSCVLLFLRTLGRSDVENQTKEINNFVSRFSEMKTKCDQDQKKYGSLSVKLGIVAGLFFAVILF